jgi:hypothetical protein
MECPPSGIVGVERNDDTPVRLHQNRVPYRAREPQPVDRDDLKLCKCIGCGPRVLFAGTSSTRSPSVIGSGGTSLVDQTQLGGYFC